ncbi:hypothetical protein [Mycolicibacterium sp.]|uniref:hypothetical protein n=1 Tax=Mycolicibacterium sp. TaxID=2320850 RepID=UPI0028A740EB|nr:hypothetical protein [Mycolicibacterium sp.]
MIVKEFGAAANLAEDVVWYLKAGQMDAALGNRMLDSLSDYGQAVREDEVPRLTGSAAHDSHRADDALQAVGDALDEHAVQAYVADESSLWMWWRGLSGYPGTKQAARQDPVDAMNVVIATRP